MRRPPRLRQDRVLTAGLLIRAYLFLGGFEAVAAMAAFGFVYPGNGYIAATTACLGAIVMMQIVNVQLCRSAREPALQSMRRWNPIIVAGTAIEVALMLAIAYTPGGNAVFATAPLPAGAWLFVLPFAVAMLVADEVRKWVSGHVTGRQRPPSAGHD